MYYSKIVGRIIMAAVALIGGSACAESFAYKELGAEQLDRAYNQSLWAPSFKETIAGYRIASEQIKKAHPPVTLAYGNAKIEKLDIFRPDTAKDLPVMIFLHGGAWKAGSKDESAGPAKTFMSAGVIYIAVDFDVIPQTDLPGMVNQARRAILWVYANAEKFGADRNRIFVSGHSSGGHLAAMMLTTDWTKYGAPKKIVKGGLILSGMGDLLPPMKSARGAYLKLTPSQVLEYSPIKHMRYADAPVIVAWGSKESPEFIRQGKELAEAFRKKGQLYFKQEIPEVDHFVVANFLNENNNLLSNETLEMIRRH